MPRRKPDRFIDIDVSKARVDYMSGPRALRPTADLERFAFKNLVMVGGGRISLLNRRQTAQFDDADEHAPISFG